MSIKLLMEYQIALVIKLSTVTYVINWVYRNDAQASDNNKMFELDHWSHLLGKMFSCLMPVGKYQFESFPLASFASDAPKISWFTINGNHCFSFRWIFNSFWIGWFVLVVKVIAHNFPLFFLIICSICFLCWFLSSHVNK